MVYQRQVWPQTEVEDKGRRGENFKVNGGNCSLFLPRARQDSHCSATVAVLHDCDRMWLEGGREKVLSGQNPDDCPNTVFISCFALSLYSPRFLLFFSWRFPPPLPLLLCHLPTYLPTQLRKGSRPRYSLISGRGLSAPWPAN